MDNKAGNTLRDYLELSKLKIMLPVSLTGFTGYFIFNPHLTRELLFVTAGILLLAASASILNQMQEVTTDRLMDRTRSRPLPAGRVQQPQAIIFLSGVFVTGILFVSATGSIPALLTSILTIMWYNGVYTLLKRVTPFAVIPGALTGALPPLIGWLAAGGPFPDTTILLLMLLFFIGQIPHFWLFILKYGEQYEAAGLPSLTSVVTRKAIIRLIVVLVTVTAITAMSFPYFGVVNNRFVVSGLMAASVILVIAFLLLPAVKSTNKTASAYSMILDSYFLLVIIILISDRMISL